MHPVTQTPDPVIRPATIDDLPVLLQFEQGVIAAERPFDPTLKEGHIHYYDIEGMIHDANVELVVAESAGKVIASGYARIEKAKHFLRHPKHAYLGFMYVQPDHRGQGINQRIISTLKEWAISKGITEMRLDVYSANLLAIKAYEKAGFARHMEEMRMGI